MDRGYVKIWRKTVDSGLLQHPTALQVFMYLLLTTSHKEQKRIVAGSSVKIPAGSVLTGRAKLAAVLELSEKQVRTALGLLEKLEIVTIKRANKYSIVSFVNWDRYQNERPAEGPAESPANGPGKGQVRATKQELKNININTLTTFECLSPKVGDVPSRPEEHEPEKQEEPEESTAKRPPCPAKEIVELYHEILPEHPRVEILNETRRRSINARWSDIGTRLKEKGREDTRAARLAYMRQIFLKASQSDFLCGRTTCRDGKTYMVTFDKLMSQSGFIGVIEGKYDNRG